MAREIKHFGILCHPTNTLAPKLIPGILEWAKERDVRISLEMPLARAAGADEYGMFQKEMVDVVEMIVVFGGDGSILQAVRTFAPHHIAVAGINLGRLGFLTLGLARDTSKVFQNLADGKYFIEDRMMLEACVKRNGRKVYHGIAMNDAVIIKTPISRVIELEVSISRTVISSFRGDGVIFSTPTGSTAYSLSSGGPLIPPWIRVLLLCPLSSHTLNARPVVVSDKEVFSARLSCTYAEVELVIDGQEGFSLRNDDKIEVFCASKTAMVVVQQPRNFFKVLRKKMKWGK